MGVPSAASFNHIVLRPLLAVMLGLMTMLIFGNVVLRYGFGSGIILADELSRLLFVWLTFIGAIAGMIENEHIGADFILRLLSGRTKIVVSLISSVVIVVLMSITSFGMIWMIQANKSATLPVSGLSVTTQFLPVLLFTLFAGGFVAYRVLTFLRGLAPPESLIYMPEAQHVAEVVAADAAHAPIDLQSVGRS